MPKIKIKYLLKSLEDTIDKEVIGIKNNNTIIFKDDEVLMNIEIFDSSIMMKRETDDYLLNLSLGNKNKYNIYLKQNNSYMDLDLNLKELNIKEQEIFFSYEIVYDKKNKDQIEFSLKYEVISC